MPRLLEPSLKQKRWLKAYSETGDATEASRRSYNCSNPDSYKVIGHKNLTKVNRGELDLHALARGDNPNILSKDQVLEIFSNIAQGKGTRVKPSDMLRGAELMARFYSMLKEQQVIEHKQPAPKTEQDLDLEFKQFLEKDRDSVDKG